MPRLSRTGLFVAPSASRGEAAGRWAIAPDQRGYGLTSRPDAIEAYDIEALTGDMVALLDHLGVDKAVFCGHDWGGIVTWQMPLRHADRVAGIIGVNTPFMPRAPADPIAIMRRRFGDDMYIVNFQKFGEADAILAADVGRTMSFFMRRPMVGVPAPSGGLSGGDDEAPQSNFALVKALQAWDPAADPRESFLSSDEMAAFVETFERTGFTGGDQLVSQLHPQLGAVGGPPRTRGGAIADGDGRTRRRPATFRRRWHGSLRAKSGQGPDQG